MDDFILYVAITPKGLSITTYSNIVVKKISLIRFLKENPTFIQIRRDCAVNKHEIIMVDFTNNTVVLNNKTSLKATGKYLLNLKRLNNFF
jgi:DNA-binding LytR/AlgR family response regulator